MTKSMFCQLVHVLHNTIIQRVHDELLVDNGVPGVKEDTAS